METRLFKGLNKGFEVQGDPDDAYFSMLPDHDLGGLANYLQRLVEIKNLSVCLDIGANIRLSTLLVSEIFPACKVFAFEPTPSTFKHLEAHIGRHCQNTKVSLHQLAVGGEVGTAKFHSDETNSHTNHVVEDRDHGIDVKMTTINGFVTLHSFPSVDFIKLDIEGAELSALRAANRTLVRHRPTIFLEFNEYAIVNNFGLDSEEYLRDIMYAVGALVLVDPLGGHTTLLPSEAKDALIVLRLRMKTERDVFDLAAEAV